jgi:hypothetical protein
VTFPNTRAREGPLIDYRVAITPDYALATVRSCRRATPRDNASRITSMHLLRSLRRRFRRQDVDLHTEAEAKTLASDRLSIRISQAAASPSSSGGLVTPTPDVLHPDEDER